MNTPILIYQGVHCCTEVCYLHGIADGKGSDATFQCQGTSNHSESSMPGQKHWYIEIIIAILFFNTDSYHNYMLMILCKCLFFKYYGHLQLFLFSGQHLGVIK